ncbi:hypothetical protein LCGC14_0757510 [marine sediment metagenome]|uniref:HNH nuclease domain-containing protein n=1 Tax=marine sediment metagenome TaxID=412755 RepID=A0A0F9Q6A9_9ZZZZ
MGRWLVVSPIVCYYKCMDAHKFWARVKLGKDCWLWTGNTNTKGYGLVRVEGRRISAHRIAYELYFGKAVPAGRYVCHHCDNPPCVNPYHLYVGTPAQNSRDMVVRGRAATGENHGTATRPERVARGSKQGLARLTENMVLEIRNTSGKTQRALAKEFGVSQRTIFSILRRETWTHV